MSCPNSSVRTNRVYVRFSDNELLAAKDRAHATGRSLAVYLRDVTLRSAPKARVGNQFADVIHQLSRTVVALQRLANLSSVAADGLSVSVNIAGVHPVLREADAVLQRVADFVERRA